MKFLNSNEKYSLKPSYIGNYSVTGRQAINTYNYIILYKLTLSIKSKTKPIHVYGI